MAQEGGSDFASKFSTLNVNAMEFVPSFCTAASATPPSPPPPTNTTTTTVANTAEPAAAIPASKTTTTAADDDDDGGEEQRTTTMATAATTEVIAEKTPENAGKYDCFVSSPKQGTNVNHSLRKSAIPHILRVISPFPQQRIFAVVSRFYIAMNVLVVLACKRVLYFDSMRQNCIIRLVTFS